MEFLAHSTLTVPLALAPPSTAAAQDRIVPSFLVQETEWWSVPPAFEERDEFSVESSAEQEKKHVNLLYRLLTGNIMPFFLMFQWVLEVYDDDDGDTMVDISLVTILAITAIFIVLMVLYRNTMHKNFWALLAPSLFLAVANALVLLQCSTFAFWVIGGGLVGMAGVISFESWFRSRDNDHDDREWLLQNEHQISVGLQELRDP